MGAIRIPKYLTDLRSAIGGPGAGAVKGFWFGPDAPPDASWIWVITSAVIGPVSVQAAAALLGVHAPGASVQALGAAAQVVAQAALLGRLAPAPGVVALSAGGVLALTASPALLGVLAAAPGVVSLSSGAPLDVTDDFTRAYAAYSGATAYVVGDYVTWATAQYRCIQNGTDHEPGAGGSAAYWEKTLGAAYTKVGAVAVGTAAGNVSEAGSFALRTGETFTANQYAYVEFLSSGDGGPLAWVRGDTSKNGYVLMRSIGGEEPEEWDLWSLFRWDLGVPTWIADYVGSVFGLLQISGSTLTVKTKDTAGGAWAVAPTVAQAGGGSGATTRTDATYATGKPGFGIGTAGGGVTSAGFGNVV
jgi:hypothetical protein